MEQEIDTLIQPHHQEIELLDTIPGISQDAAASILAEIGPDMSKFPIDAHLASWVGVCPANNESAGKKKSKKNRRGNKGLKSVLCQAGWAAIKSKNTRISSVYNRLLKRCGPQKANTAIAHLMIRIIYVMLRDKVPYQELGERYLGSKEKTVDYWVRKIREMGYQVELTETTI
ncbi:MULTISPECIES: transposase [unclassified Paenibacillus]|uniref:transposase n=1 Tax=unclassified Paenibacillus TaxID=185978 RepID=UPI00363C5C90